MKEIDKLTVNAIRVISADAIQKAKSGHPGFPLGTAAIGYELFARHMNHNPADPSWPNRDRFVLSGGHGSMLLYSLLHFFGYGLTMDDIKQFRQWGSLTPGHPEYGHTVGVEATTGPLGTGMADAVGMALAEEHLASVFNKENFPVVDHYTYVLGGDGCMMEGISSEAFSFAGSMGLSKLIVLYDSNKISIEGNTDITFTENVEERMRAFGFQTLTVEDGNDCDAIGRAIEEAKADTEHPSFITVKTVIGYGCPAKQGKASAHGEPLGEENVKALRENLGWPVDEPFTVPQEVYDNCAELAKAGEETEAAWNVMFAAYCEQYPEMAKLWDTYFSGRTDGKIFEDPEYWTVPEKAEATRASSGRTLNYLAAKVPNMIGGSADLGPSNKTEIKGVPFFSKEARNGRNIHFGVREQAMSAITNGIALHGGLRPYEATFFVFSDYCKPLVRLAALMKLPVTYVFTHDSIGVGEDGPTHEPIEQLAMLRAVPNLHVFRPCDATETEAAWMSAMTSEKTPTALVLSRQGLPQLPGSSRDALKGGYVIDDCEGTPDAILIATGSEVHTAVEAKKLLTAEGKKIRVVSLPCQELFDRQPVEYREKVLPSAVRRRVAVEALSGFGWEKYVGLDGKCVCMTGFGASAPGGELFERFGFTAEHVAETVKSLF
ncbi:transketolase [Clostridium vitabionis]|uniref:transketolase n=1 Tax=Clostridium vitabionis TaxID=2784388 RepID=UPI00188AA722|nr:transketolase [Clostridium vitabionis]